MSIMLSIVDVNVSGRAAHTDGGTFWSRFVMEITVLSSAVGVKSTNFTHSASPNFHTMIESENECFHPVNTALLGSGAEYVYLRSSICASLMGGRYRTQRLAAYLDWSRMIE